MANPKPNTTVHLMTARTSYLYISSPYKNDDGKESFCSHLLIPPDHPQVQEISEKIRVAAQHEWPQDFEEVLQAAKAKQWIALRRGEVGKPGVDHYRGRLYISSSNKSRPRLVDANAIEVPSNSPLFYSGCWVNAIITFWAQNNKYGKKINCELNGLQFLKDDERLGGGGRVAGADEFGPVKGREADAPAPATSGGASSIL
jgi:Protein of unknown function (DUF2815)